MLQQHEINYTRIACAIDYIKRHFRDQPSLDELADVVHMSRYHFQRVFHDWVGVSPKKFVQYLSLEYAKKRLREPGMSLLDAAHGAGLSGSSRLHDLFVSIEGMTPGEFKNGGEQLVINYQFGVSPFGQMLVASTARGICHMSFQLDQSQGLAELHELFPNAEIGEGTDSFQRQALVAMQQNWQQLDQVRLHLKGTPFQLKVWQALLSIPSGGLVSYGDVAQKIGKPKASRAVGTAIASNPVALLIPCHRVIQASGEIGGYRWGETRKSAIIGWEAAQLS